MVEWVQELARRCSEAQTVHNISIMTYYSFSILSVYEKLQATRAKVASVNLIYGSHFSATEATYKVSQNMGNFLEFTRTFTRITHTLKVSPSIKHTYIVVYTFSPF